MNSAASRHGPYVHDLDKNAANFAQLSPISFLQRTAAIWPNRSALIHGPIRQTWGETVLRCRKLASALTKKGFGKGDTIALLGANTPETFEAHFGVPMMGGVLNAINTRLDVEAIAFILNHGESRILIVDREFSATAQKAVATTGRDIEVIDIDDPQYEGGARIGRSTYEDLLASGDEDFPIALPEDEWDAITLNYTSGTTGNPKGVVYHHRGAYLNAISNALSWGMGEPPTFLWTLPMFHCNGWCFPWTLALMAGTSVCLRAVRAEPIFKSIRVEKVTHFCGAPIVLNMINNAPAELRASVSHRVKAMVAGAAPPAAVIAGMEKMGWDVTHVYGLTETYGPCMMNVWKDEWGRLELDQRASMKARQGVVAPLQEAAMVADPETMEPVPKDGQTMGEIFMRGNLVMKGYLKNGKASTEAFRGGWFHSGDLAVWHEDGYCEIRDRSKDIIISGGENISSIEVEGILYRHPDVLEAAVAARPDEKWGETPCAFVTLKEGGVATEADIITFCKANMAGFKVPKTVVFGPLPKTSTGKIQKFVLRDRARALGTN